MQYNPDNKFDNQIIPKIPLKFVNVGKSYLKFPMKVFVFFLNWQFTVMKIF